MPLSGVGFSPMAAIMILTITKETRTGAQAVQISLPRIDALLDQPRYSLPPQAAYAPAEPKPPPDKPQRRWR
jgi:hypothetical protein